MNLRHAAALSLMGWLLVLPPPGPGGQGNDTSAPLVTRFKFKTAYSSSGACEKAKSQLISLHPPNPKDPEEQGKGSLNARKLASVYPTTIRAPAETSINRRA
jgi:hypothetical protein